MKVFAAVTFFPYNALHDISKLVSKMAARTADPRIAMHVCNRGAAFGEEPQGAKPGIAVMVYVSERRNSWIDAENCAGTMLTARDTPGLTTDLDGSSRTRTASSMLAGR